jgi:hypothetical protein
MRGQNCSFGHIPSIEQSKKGVFITVIYNIFTLFYGSSEKCKALYSVSCILVDIVNFIHLLCSMWHDYFVLLCPETETRVPADAASAAATNNWFSIFCFDPPPPPLKSLPLKSLFYIEKVKALTHTGFPFSLGAMFKNIFYVPERSFMYVTVSC